MRVHKSFIVALDKIDTIERNTLKIGNRSIPIGNNYREQFFKDLKSKE